MENKYTTQAFIENASKIHNKKYDYSLVNYLNSKTKVNILCPIHGNFGQIPSHHLNGSGCPDCSGNRRLNTKEFILKSNVIHNKKYDYSLVNYLNNKTKVIIVCSVHGNFEQKPSHHLNGSGCPKCGNDIKSFDYFLEKSKQIHGDYYDYSKVVFINTNKKVIIVCPTHGEFEQRPFHHMGGSGCPICKQSKGERKIRTYLIENNINFIPQKRFKDCRDKKPLPFDFYLPDYNICIEYDGEQHHKVKNHWGGEKEFLKIKQRDKIKSNYCQNKKIKLIRLNENNINNINKTI